MTHCKSCGWITPENVQICENCGTFIKQERKIPDWKDEALKIEMRDW